MGVFLVCPHVPITCTKSVGILVFNSSDCPCQGFQIFSIYSGFHITDIRYILLDFPENSNHYISCIRLTANSKKANPEIHYDRFPARKWYIVSYSPCNTAWEDTINHTWWDCCNRKTLTISHLIFFTELICSLKNACISTESQWQVRFSPSIETAICNPEHIPSVEVYYYFLLLYFANLGEYLKAL